MQWGIGIKIIRTQAGISGRLRRHHGETTPISGGQMETNSSRSSTQVQQRSSRIGLTAVRTDHSIIRTGQGKIRKGQTTGVIAIKGIRPIGTTGTRVIKGVLMCHLKRPYEIFLSFRVFVCKLECIQLIRKRFPTQLSRWYDNRDLASNKFPQPTSTG